VIRYMGEGHPTLGFVVSQARRVNTYSSEIEDRDPGDPGLGRWMVGVVLCPYCTQRHEHPVARRAGWGWYEALCKRGTGVGYYLTDTPST
jgi:hypothetical protein